MLGHEDLVGGVGGPGLGGAALDLDHAVEAGGEHDEHGGAHGLGHDGAPPALDPIEGHDHQLPQGGLEQEGQDQRHLGEDHGVQQLYHLSRNRKGSPGKTRNPEKK